MEKLVNYLPMMSPVEFAIRRKWSIRGTFAAHPGAEDETDDDAHEAENQHKNAQIPG